MTSNRPQEQRRQPSSRRHTGDAGEVLISGVDTGPAGAERKNLTPTEEHVRFQAFAQFLPEPDNEDG